MFKYLFILFIAFSVFLKWQTVTPTDIKSSSTAEIEISSELEKSNFEIEQHINNAFNFLVKFDSFQFLYVYFSFPGELNTPGSCDSRAPPKKVS